MTPGKGECKHRQGPSTCSTTEAEDWEPKTWITPALQTDDWLLYCHRRPGTLRGYSEGCDTPGPTLPKGFGPGQTGVFGSGSYTRQSWRTRVAWWKVAKVHCWAKERPKARHGHNHLSYISLFVSLCGPYTADLRTAVKTKGLSKPTPGNVVSVHPGFLCLNYKARCSRWPGICTQHQQEHQSGKGWGLGQEEPHGRSRDIVTHTSLSELSLIRYYLLMPVFSYNKSWWARFENKSVRHLLSMWHAGPIPVYRFDLGPSTVIFVPTSLGLSRKSSMQFYVFYTSQVVLGGS